MFSVGIGSDYDGIGETPVGLEDVSKYPDLVGLEFIYSDCILLTDIHRLLNSTNVDGPGLSLLGSQAATYSALWTAQNASLESSKISDTSQATISTASDVILVEGGSCKEAATCGEG